MLRQLTAVPVILAAAVALAACGGSNQRNSGNSASSGQRSSGLKLAECIRIHGVPDFPDPSGGGFGIQAAPGGSISVDGHQLNVNAPAFQRAMHACQKYQPQGHAVSAAQLAKIKQGALRMAQCMRTHGVPDFPDPKVSTGPGGRGISIEIGVGAGGGGGVTPRSPAFQHAQKICQPLTGFGPRAQAAP